VLEIKLDNNNKVKVNIHMESNQKKVNNQKKVKTKTTKKINNERIDNVDDKKVCM